METPALAVAPPGRPTLARFLIPAGAALSLLPFISAGVGLLLGVAIALLVGNPHLARTRKATHPLLALSIVGLGAGTNLHVVLRVGAQGLVYTAVGITLCLAVGLGLARLMKLPGHIGSLISVGTAICGGSAIAAVVPVLNPRDEEVSVALATVFLLNAIALFLFPAIGHALHLDALHFGTWAALAIHDTSSVVGAALAFGQGAVDIATPMKLARALWIIPLTVGLGIWARSKGSASKAKPRRPWFILGFALAAALVTYVPALQAPGAWVYAGAKRLLVLTLFVIGSNLDRAALRSVGARPLLHGVVLWALVASATLAAILSGLIA